MRMLLAAGFSLFGLTAQAAFPVLNSRDLLGLRNSVQFNVGEVTDDLQTRIFMGVDIGDELVDRKQKLTIVYDPKSYTIYRLMWQTPFSRKTLAEDFRLKDGEEFRQLQETQSFIKPSKGACQAKIVLDSRTYEIKGLHYPCGN